MTIENNKIPQKVIDVCNLINSNGGQALLVGGAVRDLLLGVTPKDFDIEAYKLQPDALIALLDSRTPIDVVGESFGVIKIKGTNIDVSLPRRESKTGDGHKDFAVTADPTMTVKEAALRRDFTINSMAYNPITNTLYDEFDGAKDLENKVLRRTSEHFVEDPLRVLRGMQFAARFGLSSEPHTIALCRTLTPEHLSKERLYEEWNKLMLKGKDMSLGLNFLRMVGWTKYFPALHAIIGVPQNMKWHQEGDVWNHTCLVMDEFAKLRDMRENEPEENSIEEEDALILGYACLGHDLGKATTTTTEPDGYIRSIGHEDVSAVLTETFLMGLTRRITVLSLTPKLVAHHMKIRNFHDAGAGKPAIRRLATECPRLDLLIKLSVADHRGRIMRDENHNLIEDKLEAEKWFYEKVKELMVTKEAPRKIVMGRHLVELGVKPGITMGRMLQACFEAQLEGKITNEEEGLAFARELVAKQPNPQ